MENGNYAQTKSVCPECLKTIDAEIQIRDGEAYLVKTCDVHGYFETLIWEGEPSLEKWSSLSSKVESNLGVKDPEEDCPHNCGICSGHKQQTCCVLLEITQRCNLKCPVCFASAGDVTTTDPSLAVIKGWYEMLIAKGGPYNIQLSGGEPTLREDLPEIIRLGKAMGFEFIQINTNGLKLAENPSYAKTLAEAGLDCAFLQFDGLRETTHEKIRGKKLRTEKIQAIENCKKSGIGVVLVPTLVPGVNDDEIGEIIKFAGDYMPWVRGVHFQPISYFGRYPEGVLQKRMTLPQVIREIEKQTEGQMPVKAFVPPSSEHPYCSFNSKFHRDEEGHFISKSEFGKTQFSCCSEKGEAVKAREFVARQWVAPKPVEDNIFVLASPQTIGIDTSSLDQFLEKAKHTLAVSGMAFQDAWNLDIDRLKYCHIHVVSREGKLIPFCAYNLTSTKGVSIYR